MARQSLLSKRSRVTKPPPVGSSQMGVFADDFTEWWGAKFPSKNPSGVTVTADSSLNFSAVYAARRIISTTLASLPIDIVKKSVQNGLEVRERMPAHPVSRCLSMYPNADQTAHGFKENVGMQLTGWGNFYAEIDWGGPRLFLHPLAASRMTVERDSSGRLEYIYTGDGTAKRMPQSKVVHVPLLGDGVIGQSPISYARESIGMGIAAEQFGAAYFSNGLNPGGILVHPGQLKPEGRKNLINALERRHQGPAKAGKMMLLEEGIKWESVGIPAKDAQFLETRQFQILEISRWFGIPPHMLGDASQAKWANVTQYAVEFAKYTIVPYALRIEEEINRKLLWPTDETLCAKFNLWALLRGDVNEQLDAMIKGLGNGLYTINEALGLLDRNPMEGEAGNTRWLTQQYVPVERALNPPEPQQPQQDEDQETQTEETTDDESERSHKTIGEPRTVTGSADDAWRVVFRGSVGQVVAIELKAMQTLLRKSDTQEQLFKAVGDFMDKHDERVKECIGPCWQARGMMLGETIDVPKCVSRYVADVRHLMLDAVRNHGGQGLSTLVDVWSNGRADQVVTQYMDVSRN